MPDTDGRLWSVNALASELNLDRRTIGRRLRAVVPARVEGRSRLYTLRSVFEALLSLEK